MSLRDILTESNGHIGTLSQLLRVKHWDSLMDSTCLTSNSVTDFVCHTGKVSRILPFTQEESHRFYQSHREVPRILPVTQGQSHRFSLSHRASLADSTCNTGTVSQILPVTQGQCHGLYLSQTDILTDFTCHTGIVSLILPITQGNLMDSTCHSGTVSSH